MIIDLRLVDDLVDFGRGPGFVLHFSDTGFADFFASELKRNIDDPKYAVNGDSKGRTRRLPLTEAVEFPGVHCSEEFIVPRSSFAAVLNSACRISDQAECAQEKYQD